MAFDYSMVSSIMNPQTLASTANNSSIWANALGGAKDFFSNGQNLANMGNIAGVGGQLYNAYNSKNLMDKQMSAIDQSNSLAINDYEDQKKRRDKVDGAFSSVWG